MDSTVFHLTHITMMNSQRPIVAGHVYESLQEIARVVILNSEENEILWSNAPHSLGFIAAVAGRATSSAMLNEIKPFVQFNPIEAAQLLLLFKFHQLPNGDRQSMPLDEKIALSNDFQHLEQDPGWSKVYDSETVILYRSHTEKPKAQPMKRILPLSIAWMIITGVVFLIGYDYRRFSST